MYPKIKRKEIKIIKLKLIYFLSILVNNSSDAPPVVSAPVVSAPVVAPPVVAPSVVAPPVLYESVTPSNKYLLSKTIFVSSTSFLL